MSCHAFARIWNEMNGNKMGKFRIHFDNLAVAVDDVECRVCVLQILIRPDNELQYTRWRFIAIVVCCAKTVHIANQAWGERQCVCVCVCERVDGLTCLAVWEVRAGGVSVTDWGQQSARQPTLRLVSALSHAGYPPLHPRPLLPQQTHRATPQRLKITTTAGTSSDAVKKGLDVKTGRRTSEA